MKVAIIGGGAAGFFSAIQVKENFPDADVVIYEKSKKLLSKVKISGGGRCNVTNGETSIKNLSQAYPRGGKSLKKAFGKFNTKHTREWFESRGVPLMIQDDNCVFPVSQDSRSIIDCLLNEARRKGITIRKESKVKGILTKDQGLELVFSDSDKIIFDKIIVATGGSPKRSGLDWLAKIGHKIENPVPSLFTFNMPDEPIKKLMGVVVENTITSIQGTKLRADGPLLITHWGMSGPAILKLSAFGARILSEQNYNFKVQVNWINEINNDKVLSHLKELVEEYGRKHISNIRPYYLPERLWIFMLGKLDFSLDKRWDEIGKKGLNKVVNILTNDLYQVKGKTTFKDEFVTCGGVSLDSIDINTMQSRVVDNLFFAGEIMDIDGITGGYNFQAAWTTGFVAGKLGKP